jgi:heme-degrading monooxygenase HmoA
MITRVVKMNFREEEITAFRTFFEERRQLIRNFEGCTHLELWQDKATPTTFFTYSHWLSESHLNAYRASSFFAETWTMTKQKFASKPEAWTVETI